MSEAAAVKTTCAYCGVGCGLLATPRPDGGAAITGDPDHPANFGRLCAKGAALGETLGLEHRLLAPMIQGKRASWDDAIARVAHEFSAAIAEHGPDSVAFYVSGQLLTEDYYVANKLMKGFIGSANIDTNSRLCMASAVSGHKRAFGADVVPCNYSDIEEADLVVLVGSNLAWCHPVLHQRLMAARQAKGTKLIVIDPRRTVTADEADLHLALQPGSDVALFNGLLADVERRGATDPLYIFQHTSGLAEARDAAGQWTLSRVAAATGLEEALIQRFYGMFATTAKTVTAFSMGVNQSVTGTDKVNAIINCHLLTGRIGKPGAGPFSITGQPNAMGGREVGGLATMLAAHMEIGDPQHRRIVREFWKSPRIAEKPGLKAVDLFKAVGAGRIKALWIMATNPAVSMPQSGAIAEALKACPFVAVSDVTADTETAAYAQVMLPAAGWGEKDGTVTNSERRISRQRAFLAAPGEARPDWKIVCAVAKAMGFDGFDYRSPADIFREHAALSAKSNDGSRAFNLEGLASLSDSGYDTLAPYQWQKHPFVDGAGFHPDGRMRFVPTPVQASHREPKSFTLNTGRIRDQWHTMTRTGLVPRLFSARAEPFLEIHPADAAELELEPADIVEVSGTDGKLLLRSLVTNRVRRGEVFAPMHWSAPFASAGLVNHTSSGAVDPLSGQPELKRSRVALGKFAANWFGFAVARHPPTPIDGYWSMRPVEHGFAVECAGADVPEDWLAAFSGMLRVSLADATISTFEDSARGVFRAAALRHGRLQAALFVSRNPPEVARDWVASRLALERVSSGELLAGLSRQPEDDAGPLVCLCNSVRQAHILEAAQIHGSLKEVCQATNAGTACGSCRSDILKLLTDSHPLSQAAE